MCVPLLPFACRRADRPCTLRLGKDWLHKMLEPNPEQRMSMLEALQHPWLAEEEEVKTPLMVETFNIKNNVMRGAANPTFGDSCFEQSVGNSTPVTPASISASCKSGRPMFSGSRGSAYRYQHQPVQRCGRATNSKWFVRHRLRQYW